MRKSLRSRPHQALITALVEARKKTELTQEQLAKRLGRPQSFVAKYEGGERRLDVVELLEIAQAIDLKLPEVLKKVSCLIK